MALVSHRADDVARGGSAVLDAAKGGEVIKKGHGGR